VRCSNLSAYQVATAFRGWLRGAVALLCILSIFSPLASGQKVLRARLNSDIMSLDPGTLRDDNTDSVLLQMVEGLVGSRDDGSIGPMLASQWTVTDNARTFTFKLRSEVHFHNGAPLTSSEVRWTFEHYLDPATHWRCNADVGRGGSTPIVAVDTPDPHTVVVHLGKAAPLFLQTIARSECGGTGIMHPDSVGSDGKFRAPIGTGPFMFGSWKRNQYIQLLRFPQYSSLPGPRNGNVGGKHVLVDELRFLIIPDSSAARVALLRGSIDVMDNIDASELDSLRGKPGIYIELTTAMDNYVLLLQTNDPVLRDVRLRQAIALCIDTEGLARVATHGTARPNNSPVPTVSPYYKATEAVILKPDIVRARELVKDSSYRGQPITIITNRRYPQNFDAAVLVQAMVQPAGINLEIETLDWAGQLQRYAPGNYQIMAFGFSARLDPSFNFATFIGDKATEPRKVWDTPEARELLAKSLQTDDPAARQPIFDELDRLFRRDVPAIVFYNSSRIAATRTNVVGYKGWVANEQRFWDVGLQ
jgi:peptide/nickel transport system substrate-binding protein